MNVAGRAATRHCTSVLGSQGMGRLKWPATADATCKRRAHTRIRASGRKEGNTNTTHTHSFLLCQQRVRGAHIRAAGASLPADGRQLPTHTTMGLNAIDCCGRCTRAGCTGRGRRHAHLSCLAQLRFLVCFEDVFRALPVPDCRRCRCRACFDTALCCFCA